MTTQIGYQLMRSFKNCNKKLKKCENYKYSENIKKNLIKIKKNVMKNIYVVSLS